MLMKQKQNFAWIGIIILIIAIPLSSEKKFVSLKSKLSIKFKLSNSL